MKVSKNQPTWSSGPQKPVISEGGVHLWRGSISEIIRRTQWDDLSEAEKIEAAALQMQKPRDQFVVSRWATRQILARYLDVPAKQLAFCRTENGKPEVSQPSPLPLQFNRSHTGDWWILAVSKRGAVGVDIEQIRDRVQMGAIVKRWFTEQENQQFNVLAKPEQQDFFFRKWTMKEAVLKASGVGLGHLSEISDLQENFQTHFFSLSQDVVGCVAQASLNKSLAPEFHIF